MTGVIGMASSALARSANAAASEEVGVLRCVFMAVRAMCLGSIANLQRKAQINRPKAYGVLSQASILRLLFTRCPPAVARFVVTVVVYPLQRQALRPLTHVGKEVLERMAPAATHSNAATTVVLPRPIIGIGTTLAHGEPNPIRSSLFGTLGMHREPNLSGVMRAAVSAARPLSIVIGF